MPRTTLSPGAALCALASALALASAPPAAGFFTGAPSASAPAAALAGRCSAQDQLILATRMLQECPKDCTRSSLEREVFSLDKCLDDALEYGDICGAEGRGSCAAFVAGLTQSELGCLAAYHRRSDLNAFRVELAYVGVACQGSDNRTSQCGLLQAEAWAAVIGQCAGDCAHYQVSAPLVNLPLCETGQEKFGVKCTQSSACMDAIVSLSDADYGCHPFAEHPEEWVRTHTSELLTACAVGASPPPPPPPPTQCTKKWVNLIEVKCVPDCDWGESAWDFKCSNERDLPFGDNCNRNECRRALDAMDDDDWSCDFLGTWGFDPDSAKEDVVDYLWGQCFPVPWWVFWVNVLVWVVVLVCCCGCCVVCLKHPKCPLFQIMMARKIQKMQKMGMWPPPEAKVAEGEAESKEGGDKEEGGHNAK